jgi:hypothetical protein
MVSFQNIPGKIHYDSLGIIVMAVFTVGSCSH